MIANGIIVKDLKALTSKNCESDATLDDNVDFVNSDESNTETPLIQNRKQDAPVRETAPIITSQKTPNIPMSCDKLGEIKAMNSFFRRHFYDGDEVIFYE